MSGDKRSGTERAFTLIELLVVMAILALLLSVAIPRYFGQVDKAKESVLRQDLALMRDSIDKFYADNGRYPNTLAEMVENKYLRKIPVDPITGRSDTWIVIAPANKDINGVFDVKSGAPDSTRTGGGYGSW